MTALSGAEAGSRRRRLKWTRRPVHVQMRQHAADGDSSSAGRIDNDNHHPGLFCKPEREDEPDREKEKENASR